MENPICSLCFMVSGPSFFHSSIRFMQASRRVVRVVGGAAGAGGGWDGEVRYGMNRKIPGF